MKKNNNRYLKGYQTFFASLGAEDKTAGIWWNGGKCYVEFGRLPAQVWPIRCGAILASVSNGAATFPARVIVQGSLAEMTREWFQQGAYGTGWHLKSYSHESRTGVYEDEAGLAIAVTRAANWIESPNVLDMIEAYTMAEDGFKAEFGFPFLGSPTITGLYAMEQTLKPNVDCPALPDDFAETLHAGTTQGRSEMYLPADLKSFHLFDRRFAYAADVRFEMPCGVPQYEQGGEFVPYDPAFYRVRFTVPTGWHHVGLLPVLVPGSGWQWPVDGTYETFVAEPELRLAAGCHWPFEVLECWRFEKARPLENWRNRLVKLWDDANARGCKGEADIYRRILLHAIGGLYARTYAREFIATPVEFADLNDDAALTAEQVDGGFRIQTRANRDKRFYMPHWAAMVWSRARAVLASRMLTLPIADVLACHVDAIYSRAPLQGVGNEVGQFRLKGSLQFNVPETLRTRRDLQQMAQFAERCAELKPQGV